MKSRDLQDFGEEILIYYRNYSYLLYHKANIFYPFVFLCALCLSASVFKHHFNSSISSDILGTNRTTLLRTG